MADAERSAIEIKVLLKNLDPTKSSIKHKDRLRRLNKFRNYVTTNPPPEFYDDDHCLLLLGSECPTALDDEELEGMNLVGLLRATGCPSTDHKDSLKRSARPTISLLRYLCLDFGVSQPSLHSSSSKSGGGGKNAAKFDFVTEELNGFASALCALNIPQLRTMRLDIHIGKGDDSSSGSGAGGNAIMESLVMNSSSSRGGSKDDACALLALILTRHTDTDCETPKPLKMQDFLPEKLTQAEFEAWLGENASPDVRRVIHSNEKESISGGSGGGPVVINKALTGAVVGKSVSKLGVSVVAAKGSSGGNSRNPFTNDNDDDDVDDDVRGLPNFDKGLGSKSKNVNEVTSWDEFVTLVTGEKPTRWAETQMATETSRASGAMFLEEERAKAIAERQKADEEKRRVLGRDPLGIHSTEGFDLQELENNREQLIYQTLEEIEAEIEKEMSLSVEAGVEKVNWLEAQRQSLLSIIEEKKMRTDTSESKGGVGFPSILPTSPDFDPILFLTLAHRHATYQELQDSISRLSRKTDNQVERLQNFVRDHFALFIKCSEGVDIFGSDQSDSEKGKRQVQNQFGTLDNIAQSCAEQARKSFKPLLDNTNEVRKVQSALSVLQRVAPLLQVPSLMRQHIENANFSAMVKAYRKVLVIDKDHRDVDLLRFVRVKAGEAAQDARQDLELILADETSPASSLLDAIRDLGALLELLDEDGGSVESDSKAGTFTVDGRVIRFCDHPPALACLLLQASHFLSLVGKAVASTEATAERCWQVEGSDSVSHQSGGTDEVSSEQRSRDKRWKFDVLEARVDATLRAVTLAKNWLPRLLQIGFATHEAEKRQTARKLRATFKNKSSAGSDKDMKGKGTNMMTAHKVFETIVNPALTLLVEHVAFCSLGCANQASEYKITPTYGNESPERLRSILKSPLPPTQTAKCAQDLTDLAELIGESKETIFTSNDGEGNKATQNSPLERCYQMINEAVGMIEQRVCIYSFDACARKCSISATGSGTFEGDALLQCVQKLSDDLTRSDECYKEIEKGCLLVTQKCCEGMTNYVKDRSDAARLRVVAECADALNTTIVDVGREVSYLTNGRSESLQSTLSTVISALEKEMFDVFLESVKRAVSSSAKLGLIDNPSDNAQKSNKAEDFGPFPPYLAASFLTIVRCRAQVERALRDLRRSDGATYQLLTLQTVSDGVVESICIDIKSKINKVRPRAEVYAIHIQFLISTLKKYLSDDVLSLASDTRRMLGSASPRGIGVGIGMGNGPEGLAALENLERLGRVYVMCLGD